MGSLWNKTHSSFTSLYPYNITLGRSQVSRKYETSGQTPLHVAASCGHSDMVQLLIGAGADIGNMVVSDIKTQIF